MYGYLRGYPNRIPFLCGEGEQLGSAYWTAMPQSEYARLGILERPEVEEAFFALSICVSDVPQECPVRVSAVNRYRLYVNGVLCGFGPRKGDAYSHYYETIDIAAHLRSGTNVIGAYVVSATEKALQFGPGKVLSACSVFSDLNAIALVLSGRIGSCDISTGVADWRVRKDVSKRHHYYPPADLHGTFEKVDFHLIDERWKTDPEAFSDWTAAERLFKPGCNYYGQMRGLPLMPRPIPMLFERPEAFAGVIRTHSGTQIVFENGSATIPPHTKASCILDAGTHRTAFIATELEGENALVRYTYAESFVSITAEGDTHKALRDDPSGEIVGAYDEILTSSRCSYEPFWFRTFRYIRLDVETADSALTLRMPKMRATGYPMRVQSHVRSSCDDIGWLWDVSVQTLQNSIHETFTDCPYYEQLQYVMDSKLESDYMYAISGDTTLPSASIWDFHCSLRPDGMLSCSYPSNETQVIPGFALQWVWMVERYYNQTADRQVAAFYRPTIDAILAYFDRHIGPQGLCEGLGYWEFADWTKEWNGCHGRPSAIEHGPCSLFNMMYVYTLQMAARLNEATGRRAFAQEYLDRAQAILTALRSSCWNGERQMYRESPGFEQYCQHTQILAVLTGALKAEAAAATMKRAMHGADVVRCSLPWRYYLFRALEQCGMFDEMRECMDRIAALRKFNLTTLPEWDLEESRSDCHAWSASPLYELCATVLGVRPFEDGWAKIHIKPCPLGYPDCSGSVVTPHGMVDVRWKVDDGVMSLEVKTPHDTVVEMPDSRRYRVQAGEYVFNATLKTIFSAPIAE